MFECLISVIIPVYNAGEYLSECLQSVCEQTYRNLQIILIDDGSTDNSGLICDKFRKIDSRIEVCHCTNSGSVAARRMGIRLSKGDYIGFIDSDDYIDENMISVLYESILKYDADFVSCGLFYEDLNNINYIVYDDCVFELLNNSLDFLHDYTNVFMNKYDDNYINNSLCTKLYQRGFINKIFDELDDAQELGEDALALSRCSFNANKIVNIGKCLYHYRVRQNSLSHSKREDIIYKQLSYCEQLHNILTEYGVYDDGKEYIYKMISRLHLIYFEHTLSVYIERYKLNNINDFVGKRVAIYGAGKVGRSWYTQLCRYRKCNIVAWVDKESKNIDDIPYYNISAPETLLNIHVDVILIAMLERNIALKVKNFLVNIGIDDNKIDMRAPQMLV